MNFKRSCTISQNTALDIGYRAPLVPYGACPERSNGPICPAAKFEQNATATSGKSGSFG
ncbi:MAG: hypothetical protein ABMA14_22485 [Hyphomonadaceae bacterium]